MKNRCSDSAAKVSLACGQQQNEMEQKKKKLLEEEARKKQGCSVEQKAKNKKRLEERQKQYERTNLEREEERKRTKFEQEAKKKREEGEKVRQQALKIREGVGQKLKARAVFQALDRPQDKNFGKDNWATIQEKFTPASLRQLTGGKIDCYAYAGIDETTFNLNERELQKLIAHGFDPLKPDDKLLSASEVERYAPLLKELDQEFAKLLHLANASDCPAIAALTLSRRIGTAEAKTSINAKSNAKSNNAKVGSGGGTAAGNNDGSCVYHTSSSCKHASRTIHKFKLIY